VAQRAGKTTERERDLRLPTICARLAVQMRAGELLWRAAWPRFRPPRWSGQPKRREGRTSGFAERPTRRQAGPTMETTIS
jgi:hypothetical protein